MARCKKVCVCNRFNTRESENAWTENITQVSF